MLILWYATTCAYNLLQEKEKRELKRVVEERVSKARDLREMQDM